MDCQRRIGQTGSGAPVENVDDSSGQYQK